MALLSGLCIFLGLVAFGLTAIGVIRPGVLRGRPRSRRHIAIGGAAWCFGLLAVGSVIAPKTPSAGITQSTSAASGDTAKLVQSRQVATGQSRQSAFEQARASLLSVAEPCIRGAENFGNLGPPVERGEISPEAVKDAAQQAADACGEASDAIDRLKSSVNIASNKDGAWSAVLDVCQFSLRTAHVAYLKIANGTLNGNITPNTIFRTATLEQKECNRSINSFADHLEDDIPDYGPIPAFSRQWVPSVRGVGDFEICLTNEAVAEMSAPVTIPSNVLFQSWGVMTGDLRSNASSDLRALGSDYGDPRIRDLTLYAVLTTGPLTLSRSHQCGLVQVRAATHDGFGWRHEVVPAALHLLFAPAPNVIRGRTVLGQQWGSPAGQALDGAPFGGAAGEVIGSEGDALRGYLIRDRGEAVRLLSPL